LFVSWVPHHGRSEDLARDLGAECEFVAVGRLRNRKTAPFRYAWQSLATAWLLLLRRPRVLLVMAPPAPLVGLGLLWSTITGAKLVVDCHSKAVLGRPLSARLASHADLVLVTLPELATGFRHVLAVHDPPATASEAARHDELVFPASWAPDEPIEELLAAARALPDVRFAITGQAPTGLEVPGNVRLTGRLPQAQYLALVAGAPLVLALTDRESTMQRAAYEAVAAGRPVIASDTRALRDYLGDAAVYGDLTVAVRLGLDKLPELEAAVVRLRQRIHREHSSSLRAIASALA
jgi:hypothetical protein